MRSSSTLILAAMALGSVGALGLRASPRAAQTPPAGQPPVARVQASQPVQQGEPEPPPKLEGPMRVEPFVIYEQRASFGGQAPPPRAPESNMQFQFKLTGEKLPYLIRVSPVILEEVVDDGGRSLLDPAQLAKDRGDDFAIVDVKSNLKIGYWPLYAKIQSASRGAKSIARLKGHVNAIFGNESKDVVIENPRQYEGQFLSDPALAELGVKIRVLKIGVDVTPPPTSKGIALQFVEGMNKLKFTAFYDPWMKRMQSRGRLDKTKDGEAYTFFQVAGSSLAEDSQMVLTVYTDIETMTLPFEFTNLELP